MVSSDRLEVHFNNMAFRRECSGSGKVRILDLR